MKEKKAIKIDPEKSVDVALPEKNMETVIDRIEKYLNRYIVFAEKGYSFPMALWIAMTHCWQTFDALGYVCITSRTKQSGKTSLARLLEFTVNEPHLITAMTPGAMFHLIEDVKPVILCDEAEMLNSESAGFLRAALNSGYTRGAKIERIANGGGVAEYDIYCPKVFVLIGDVYDTLRDRSFIIPLRRARPGDIPSRFVRKIAMSEGRDLRDELKEACEENKERIEREYHDAKELLFLPSRESEIFTPLFVLCNIFCPDRLEELTRMAADMATAKTEEAINYRQSHEAEEAAKFDYFQTLLVRHIIEIGQAGLLAENSNRKTNKGKSFLDPDALIEQLKSMAAAPWRKYRGEGLTRMQMGDMLAGVGIRTNTVRTNGKVRRLFDLEVVRKKATEMGIEMEAEEKK